MKTGAAIRLLLVGGCDATEDVSAALGGSPAVEVIGEVGTCDEAVAATRELSPDVVLMLMDGMLPGTDGIDAAGAITETRPWVRVVVVTRNVVRYLIPAVKAGVAGILSPDISSDELLSAIRRIHQWTPYSLSVQ